ncbi:MAG TPA: integrase arm-type DNA-binding domain-containing protein [Burkholderiales bacterium]|nr:integrase arm-type DNA-binding domain-containing protein [Burkholderiales bacterium]
MPLTDTRIRAAKPLDKPYKITDGGGLHLEVRTNGKKLWRYRFRLNGRENVFAIGDYPNKLLVTARAERDEARKLVKQGINPAHDRRLRRLKTSHAAKQTFEAVAKEWAEEHASERNWSKSYSDTVTGVLEQELFPHLGPLPIREIKAAHLLPILRAIQKRGARTVAARARFICAEIWRYAVVTERADGDVATPLRDAVRMPLAKHHPHLKRGELPEFLVALANYPGRRETAMALKLLLLLFPRPNELLRAPWSEFDLDEAVWRIPAARMKMRNDHVIPLPTQAVELLRGLKVFTGEYVYLFPHRDDRKRPMTDAALRQALRLMGYRGRLVPHGFRGTASTALNEMNYRSEWIESQLAHTEGNSSRAAYNHASYIDQRRQMLQEWADLIDQLTKPQSTLVLGRFARAA